MTGAPPDTDRLKDEAIALVIRLQSASADDTIHERVRAWRARSALHETIWQRAMGVHDAAGALLDPANRQQRPGLSRRNLMIGGALALGGGLAGYDLLPGIMLRLRADHLTAKARTEQFRLPDGSLVTLGAASAIAVAFSPTQRRVSVLQGSAFFTAAPDPQRPFVATADRLSVTAPDAAFEIMHLGETLGVSVERGQVLPRISGTALHDQPELRAGDWLRFDHQGETFERGSDDSGKVASWRNGRVFADNEPVGLLVRRIAAWIPGRVMFADPFVGETRVSGVFDLAEPERALAAALHPTGASLRRVSPGLMIISPI